MSKHQKIAVRIKRASSLVVRAGASKTPPRGFKSHLAHHK